MRTLALIASLMICAFGFAQGEPEFAVDGKPEWYEIVGNGATTGTVCPIRAVATRQLVGNAEPGFRFLAFGANRRWITLSFEGVLSYVPVTAAQPVFQILRPASETSNEMRMPGETLEERQRKIQERAEASKTGSKPLAPNFTNQPTPKPTAMPVTVGGGGRRGMAGRGGEEGI
jgi:hypothetical protein